jgi:hypothetical protein
MSRRMLSGAAVAAMLLVAASVSASGKATATFVFPEASPPAERIAPGPVADEQGFPDRGFKTAYTLIELLPVCPGGGTGCRDARPAKAPIVTQRVERGKQPPSAAYKRVR